MKASGTVDLVVTTFMTRTLPSLRASNFLTCTPHTSFDIARGPASEQLWLLIVRTWSLVAV